MKIMKRTASAEKELDKRVNQYYGQLLSSPGNTSISYQNFLGDKLMLVKAIREGVPYPMFSVISESVPFSERDWSEILDISPRSLQRYKKQKHTFKPLHAEKIFEIAEVTEKGLEVFGDMERFRQWLETSSYALGNMKPIDLINDSYGKELVIGELHRIDHGVLA
jgi:putative toxin-antitoxin system antitoxin component (TIGR02293 family)